MQKISLSSNSLAFSVDGFAFLVDGYAFPIEVRPRSGSGLTIIYRAFISKRLVN